MSESAATHLDIFAWQSNRGVRLQLWELDAIQSLGAAWLTESSIKGTAGDLPPRMRNS